MVVLAHSFGSILWVSSNVLLQIAVPDSFRGRVFAAELIAIALVQSVMTYASAVALDRAGIEPRTLAVVIGLALWIPATLWYVFARPLFKTVPPASPEDVTLAAAVPVSRSTDESHARGTGGTGRAGLGRSGPRLKAQGRL